MKKTTSKAIIGIIFILLGFALAGRAFGLYDINLFFRGWWTLFIIIPCLIGLQDQNNRTSSAIGLGIGILLLLTSQGIFEWHMFGKILVSFLFVMIGFALILKNNNRRQYSDQSFIPDQQEESSTDTNSGDSTKASESNETYRSNNYNSTNHGSYNHYSGILSGRNIQYVDEVFTGAVISSILGNVQLDLRNAIFNGNVIVDTTCILGGVDLFVPPNIKVVFNCTPILAGVDNNIVSPINPTGESYTLFINGTCILGGIEVK